MGFSAGKFVREAARLVAMIALVGLVPRPATAASVLFETFAAGDSAYASGGWILQGGDSFLGARFELSATTHVDSIVGNLGGSGSFFVAIAGIDPEDEVPMLAPDFAPGDVVFHATNAFAGFLSRDIRTAADIILEPGRYLVFFGGLGEFGESDYGWMPNAPDLADSLVPSSEYFEYRGGSWASFPESGVRIALEGSLAAVPLPGGVFLVPPALIFLARFSRRR